MTTVDITKFVHYNNKEKMFYTLQELIREGGITEYYFYYTEVSEEEIAVEKLIKERLRSLKKMGIEITPELTDEVKKEIAKQAKFKMKKKQLKKAFVIRKLDLYLGEITTADGQRYKIHGKIDVNPKMKA